MTTKLYKNAFLTYNVNIIMKRNISYEFKHLEHWKQHKIGCQKIQRLHKVTSFKYSRELEQLLRHRV